MKQLFIGTSGYNYRDWRGRFYPEKLAQGKWLSYYAEQFSTVEINATFYGSFKEQTFHNWAAQVPDNFRFTIKGSRFITHSKRLNEVKEDVDRFFATASCLEQKLSCALWQFPGSFRYTDETSERMEIFLELLPKDMHQVIEVRHESWFTDDFFSLLNTYKTGFVINDSSKFPAVERVTDSIAYIRFHGPGALYASSYNDEQLAVWAEKIREYGKTRDVYCYFNNDYDARAIHNAKTLRHFLDKDSSLHLE